MVTLVPGEYLAEGITMTNGLILIFRRTSCAIVSSIFLKIDLGTNGSMDCRDGEGRERGEGEG